MQLENRKINVITPETMESDLVKN